MAPGLYDPSLMKGQGAKIAAPKTTSIADETELHLRDCRDPALGLIGRMIRPAIRQRVYFIHFLLCQRLRRRILHHIDGSVPFRHPLT